MRFHVFVLFLVPLLLLGCATDGQKAKKPNPAYAKVFDHPSRPNVLIIGDSISIGYTLPVREMLEGMADVFRIPENGGPTTRGLEKFDEWIGCGCYDVVHFNWGLHDLKFMDDGERQVSLDEYERNLTVLVHRLSETGAKLIWANTTPVPEGGVKPKRIPSDVLKYNAVAAEIMQRRGVIINDLYSFSNERLDKIQQPVNVHFTQEGSYELGAQVAEAILNALDQ